MYTLHLDFPNDSNLNILPPLFYLLFFLYVYTHTHTHKHFFFFNIWE